ncbi:LacI family transcriptional regulator [Paenibacillus sp. J5C_2022]|uniref:LacI family DNA-binding transcriptional regulator n=1 Tax=Paenibacillus sp. J5C2022 TaxID=2977129 RepID=UPI0021CEBEDE|nr:LacI family DNA-binding transcriptional regulator [Paenibacillus sp. J5C2022]MCU6712147.1 LacI family transcriptional regulator [Paenibacillus sp. J5C2022]
MPRKKSVTLQDLAEQLHLSVHTVSKALRGLTGMSEETREAVLQAARKAGYRTKDQERTLAMENIPIFSHKQRNFKLVITSGALSSDMNQLLLGGLQEKLSEHGHTIETVLLPHEFEHDQEESFEEWAERHHLRHADGVFIPPLIESHLEQKLLQLPVPRVMLNFPLPAAEVDSVVWDVGTSIHQSVRYLLAHGHREMLYVGSIDHHRGLKLRWQSFVAALKEAGIDTDSSEHVTGRYQRKEEWMADISEKLARREVTAILNGANQQVAWVYHACSMNGKQIPHDYSLVSLEHTRNEFLPQLTRPKLLIREAGIRGAERMLWRLANPHLPYEHILLQGGFYEGETVRRI